MKFIHYILFGIILFSPFGVKSQQRMDKKAILVIHGGSGVITREKLSESQEKDYRKELAKALQIGNRILKKGGTSEEAVVGVIVSLEDSPLFNAGKGSVLNENGQVEMDASIMRGNDLACGSVSGLKRVKNPILASQMVMNKTRHVFLSGEGGDDLAEKHDLEIEAPEYFRTERRIQQLEEQKSKKERKGSLVDPDGKYGTVGAVALDKNGNLCAATSTGGTSNKLKGRIGDTPIIGSGTYANNSSCGISCTGEGEYFIRNQAAYAVSALMEIGKSTMKDAMVKVIDEKVGTMGGSGGMIGLDSDGNYYWYFNTKGMYRGVLFEDGVMLVEIFGSP
jgi:L-asparaginase / beta-aspartyl-peptidase